MDNLIYKYILSEVGRVIWNNLSNPDDWIFTELTMHHIRTKTNLWIGHGGFWFNGYGGLYPHLGLLERHFLYNRAIILQKLNQEKNNIIIIKKFTEKINDKPQH